MPQPMSGPGPASLPNRRGYAGAAGPANPPVRQAPSVPDHKLLQPIGRGAYGEVWLARSVLGTLRAVKLVCQRDFADPAPFEREFNGIRKFEPVSRAHPALVDVPQVGRNDAEGVFYYVMELADDVGRPKSEVRSPKFQARTKPGLRLPKTLCRRDNLGLRTFARRAPFATTCAPAVVCPSPSVWTSAWRWPARSNTCTSTA